MTIATTQIRKSYACDGTTTAFPFPYQFLLDSDLVVLLVDDAAGNFSTLTLSTDYTVSGGDGSSGTVTTTSTYASGKTLVIYNDPAPTQGLDLVEGDELPPEEVEKAFDRLTLLHQRQDDRLDRALVVSDSDTSGADFTVPAPQALKYMRWNAAGNALELMALEAAGDLAVSSYIETLLDDADEDAALTTLGLPLAADTYLRRNAGNTAFVAKTVAQVVAELAPLLAVERDWRGRNSIINGDFDFWRRGSTNTTSALGTTFLADRWAHESAGSAISVTLSQQAHTLGQTDVPGEPRWFSRVDVTAATSLTKNRYRQRIEGVRTYAGQTVTVSWYMKADAARSVTPSLVQDFGTGGSPSSDITTAGPAVSLTTSWQKFTQSFSVPSISGKTIGSNDDDFLELRFDLPLGVSTIDISRVQVEPGSVATEFAARHAGIESFLCLRYYRSSEVAEAYSGYVSTGVPEPVWVYFSSPMRKAPTVVVTDVANSNFPAGSPSIDRQNTFGFRAFKTANGTGNGSFQFDWTASAEL